jgi:DNA-binding MarR family transcriptional regulator
MSTTPKPTALPSDTSALVLRRFRVVFGAVRNHFRQIEKMVGLGGAQVWALSVIQQRPGLGMGELARTLDVHQSTASNLIKALHDKALVRTEKDLEDKRHVHLYVTEAALVLLAKVPGPVQGLLPDALSRLPESTLRELDGHLVSLIRALNADETAAGIPLANL